jgi:hypothetical protein
MEVLLDLNVLLDVVQNRVPHYHESAQVLSLARVGEIKACSHCGAGQGLPEGRIRLLSACEIVVYWRYCGGTGPQGR